MPIRLLAVDLDGTLLNSNSELSPRNLQALRLVHERGIEIVVATGRRYHAARRYIDQIPSPLTLISSNGAMTRSPVGEVAFRRFLSKTTALQVLIETRPFRPYTAVLFDIPERGQILMENCAAPDGPLYWYQRTSSHLLRLESTIEKTFPEDPIQVLFGGPPALIEQIEPLIVASPVATKVHLSWTKYLARNTSLLDVMTLGCSKGSALAHWAAHRGIKPDEVMAVGDNHNDFEMLSFAGHAVVMANHSPGLEMNPWHRTGSNDEDGVAAAVEEHILGTTLLQ